MLPLGGQTVAIRRALVGRVEGAKAGDQPLVDGAVGVLIGGVPCPVVRHRVDGDRVTPERVRIAQHAIELVEVVRIDPRAVVVHPLDADKQLSLQQIEGRTRERPLVAIVADGQHGKRAFELVDVVEVGRADGGEVPFVGVVGTLSVLDSAQQLGDDEVEVAVPWPCACVGMLTGMSSTVVAKSVP